MGPPKVIAIALTLSLQQSYRSELRRCLSVTIIKIVLMRTRKTKHVSKFAVYLYDTHIARIAFVSEFAMIVYSRKGQIVTDYG